MMADMVAKGQRARGEEHGNVKLTEDNVRRIFELRQQGWSQRRLAAEFGVSRSQISRILARKVWAHEEGAVHAPRDACKVALFARVARILCGEGSI